MYDDVRSQCDLFGTDDFLENFHRRLVKRGRVECGRERGMYSKIHYVENTRRQLYRCVCVCVYNRYAQQQRSEEMIGMRR